MLGAIRDTSTEQLYQELGLESLKSRRWFRKLCHFYKIFNKKLPSYLFNFISNLNRIQNPMLTSSNHSIKVRLKNSFFPSALSEYNKLDFNFRNSASLNIFKKKLLNFMWPCANTVFNIHNPLGNKILTRLRLGLIHLHEHKLRHCFQDTLCKCAKYTESTVHFFLHCNIIIPQETVFKNS